MNNELKPCPFCGAAADVQNDFNRVYWVQCSDLDCGSTDGTEWNTISEAVTKWNRRAPAAQPGGTPDRATADIAYESLSPERRKQFDADMVLLDQRMQDRLRERERRQNKVPVEVERRVADARGTGVHQDRKG